MRAGDHRDRPREAPAVAVKHRQRPQIHRMLAHAAGDDVAEREQLRAAMVIDHALRIAGRARRVVERDRVPFVVRHVPRVVRIALRDEILVFDAAEPLAGAGILRIVIVDHQRLYLGERERLLHGLRELAIGDEHLGLGVIERERDDRGIEPRIERVEHALRHRHAVMRLEHRRRVREHHRDGVAALDAALGQRRGKAARARVKLGIIAPQRPVDHRRLRRIDRGRALQEGQRGERLEVRRIAVEIGVVGVGHSFPRWLLGRAAA